MLEDADQDWYTSYLQNDSGDKDAKESVLNKSLKNADHLFESQTKSDEIMDLAKQQHMTTDVKKAVFHSIMSSEDYL